MSATPLAAVLMFPSLQQRHPHPWRSSLCVCLVRHAAASGSECPVTSWNVENITNQQEDWRRPFPHERPW